VNFLSQSSQTLHMPGAVVARPDFTNTVQGVIEQSEDPLALAIGGQGFFSVAGSRGLVDGLPVFDDRQFFTRAGDFRLDKNGYMVNGAGYYLQGWPAIAGTENPDRTTLAPIRIEQQVFNPIATQRVELAANLPADPEIDPINTQAQVYDTLGRRHVVDLTFTPAEIPDPADPAATKLAWTLDVNVPGDVTDPARGTLQLAFGASADPAVPDGTIGSLGGETGSLTPSAVAVGEAAEFTFTADFGEGPQTITFNLGTYGVAQGLTQFAGKEFAVRNLQQDGVPLGSYAGLTMRESGDVVVNYDNGQSRVIARVPLVAFSDPDRLQRLDGQAFMRTVDSGDARVTDPAQNGVGKLITGSIERSNVDIASEFTKLIVAQRAYTANTRIVSASDEMLQDTLNMRR
jgi:flagellar hook protein FlgE